MRRNHAPFAAVVVLQLIVLAVLPARQIQARLTGTEITLKTRPVDPYDMLAGYYVTLAYQIEAVPEAMRPPVKVDTPVWLEVTPGEPAWTLVRVHSQMPKVTTGRVAIRAVWRGRQADIPEASRLYIPEDERHIVADHLNSTRGQGYVDLRVGPDGTPIVLRLRVADRSFGD